MKKIYNYGKAFLQRPHMGLIWLLLMDFIAIFFANVFIPSWYLWIVICSADIIVCFAQGAWRYHGCKAPKGSLEPYRNPINLDVHIALMVICLIAFCESRIYTISMNAAHLITSHAWYLAVVVAVSQAFRCILKTMDACDDSWLKGTNGEIGIPNWISIVRIAVALVIPDIYVRQTFGYASNTLATLILAAAIATDAVDGYIARSTHQTTKAGKALDPLGDKFILYPNAVAFIITTNGSMLLPEMLAYRTSIYIALILTVGRDILFMTWFFWKGKGLKEGIGASLVDKFRMLCICAWLGSTAIAITVPATYFGHTMAWIAFASILITGSLSVVSFIVDFSRVKALRAKNS